jgi:hypothetical protein
MAESVPAPPTPSPVKPPNLTRKVPLTDLPTGLMVALVRAGATFENGKLVERPDESGGGQQAAILPPRRWSTIDPT